MPRILNNLTLQLDEDLEEKLSLASPGWSSYRILRKSVDARRPHKPYFVYTVEVAAEGEQLVLDDVSLPKRSKPPSEKPLIVGTGPAGLFAALRFVEMGIPCVLFERGSKAEERIKGINRYWRYGELDPRNNVCFGEGGAGLYSDGKLITRIKSPHIPYVLQKLVEFGAPAEIRYLSNPHVGSDRIRRVIPRLREYLLQNGCEIHFETKVTELILEGDQVGGLVTEHGQKFLSRHVILATGHSAEDMLYYMQELGVSLEGKSFAMGLRIEHPQKEVDQIQFREAAGHPDLGAAQYRLAHHDSKTQIGVYSFCMCPGGYVLSSGTEADGVVSNGMSNYARNSPFANAAIVVTVDHETHFGSDTFGGLKLRRQLEQKAFQAVRGAGGTRQLPTQNLLDFLKGRSGQVFKGSSPSGESPVRLDQSLPEYITERIRSGLEVFESQMRGFISGQSQLYGVETRTSCPVRITRDGESLQSVSHRGLYPCGEGAGYAGGITSAACDGVRVADRIATELI